MRCLLLAVLLAVALAAAAAAAARLPVPLRPSTPDSGGPRPAPAEGLGGAGATGGRSRRGRRSQRRGKRGRRRGKPQRQQDEYLLWLRTGECQPSAKGEEQFFCPSPAAGGEWMCVGMSSFCDGVPDCPGSEDEQPIGCFFYQVVTRNVEIMAQSLLNMASQHDDRRRR